MANSGSNIVATNIKFMLRSWVQIIPPGPLLSVLEILYCFGLVLGYRRTNSAAMPLSDPMDSIFFIKIFSACISF